MAEEMTGSQIVASMTHQRDWWQLTAGDVHPWVRTLPFSATQEQSTLAEWIGEPWDGVSDVDVGREHTFYRTIPAGDIDALLDRIRQGLPALGVEGIELPSRTNVRTCYDTEAKRVVAIDIDLGDFILPVCIDHHGMTGDERPTVGEIATRILRIIGRAAAMCLRILTREIRMRRAFEETAAKIGDGAAALWLRMSPFPHYKDPKCLTLSSYVMGIVALNDDLIWVPKGHHRVHTVRNVRDHYGYLFRAHRRRAAALRKLQAANSRGSITEVALAIIEERGLDPIDVFDQAVTAALADRRGSLDFDRNGKSEKLYFREGVLFASLALEGGHYYRDTLTLWRDHPTKAAKGRPLSALTNHLAFITTGIVASKVTRRDGAVDIAHHVRLIAIEEIAALRTDQALAA